MIHLSTEKINLKSSSKELFDFLSQTTNMAQIISFKKTKHLKIQGDFITFILKWAARFNFSITAITEEYILIESTNDVEFSTAIRFDISDEDKGSSVIIRTETDTAPIIDFTFESKMKRWITAIVHNLEIKFG